jgi:hypothetical protein
MARARTTTRAVTTSIAPPAEQRAEQVVGQLVRRMNEHMSTLSRSMLAGSMGTPFDVLKANSGMPVVGTLGPQSTGYYLPPLVRFSRHLDRNDGFIAKGLDIRADATVDTGPWPIFQFQALNDLWEQWQLECDRRGR